MTLTSTSTRRAAAAAGLATILSTPAAAQDPSPLGPGVRVRVSVAASKDRLEGTVQSIDQAMLSVISNDHQLVKIPRSDITRLETGWGRKGNARKGFIIGGLIGVGGGLLACGVSEETYYEDFRDEFDYDGCEGGEWVGFPLAAGAVWGGIGALIGHFIKSDRWVEMPIDKVRLAVGPSPRGWGLNLSVRF
jgi:hypothetical protein